MVIYTELVICKVRGEMAHRASQHAAAEEGVRLWLLSEGEKKTEPEIPRQEKANDRKSSGPCIVNRA